MRMAKLPVHMQKCNDMTCGTTPRDETLGSNGDVMMCDHGRPWEWVGILTRSDVWQKLSPIFHPARYRQAIDALYLANVPDWTKED